MAATNKLTDKSIRSALTKANSVTKPIKLSDGAGLYFEVPPKGAGRWRFRYMFNGKENTLSFGLYPDVPLKLARERRADHRKLVR